MPLPDFVVAGAMKAGTTTLWAMLNQHPEIHMTRPKELHYFDRHYGRGAEWYAEQFSPAAGERLVGEATPIYMTDPLFHQRMRDTVPHVRILIILREPAARAYSHYWMMRAKGSEDMGTFEEGLAAEDRRWEDPSSPRAKWRFAYRHRGYYADQLTGLEGLFGRDRMQVLIFEEFLKAPQQAMREVFDFVGAAPDVADSVELEHRKSSRGAVKAKRGYPPMEPQTKAQMREHFAPYNAALEEWLGREVTAWRS
jgi:hypothetical protein